MCTYATVSVVDSSRRKNEDIKYCRTEIFVSDAIFRGPLIMGPLLYLLRTARFKLEPGKTGRTDEGESQH